MSRSITMNGVKATINFPDTPNPNDKPVLWELVIESGNKKSSIEGYNILAPAVIPPPVTGTSDYEYDSDYDSDNELLPAILPLPATGTATAAEVAATIAFNTEIMKWYDTCPKKTPTLNRSQKMKAFIDSNKDILMQYEESENENRKMLMMSIFKKKNLKFKDVYMDMYYKWQKNAPKQNRYKKMCSFIQAHGFK